MNMMSGRICRHPYRARRQKMALQLQEERTQRTAQQQLEILDRRLGKDKGAIKERLRLHQQIKEVNASN